MGMSSSTRNAIDSEQPGKGIGENLTKTRFITHVLLRGKKKPSRGKDKRDESTHLFKGSLAFLRKAIEKN